MGGYKCFGTCYLDIQHRSQLRWDVGRLYKKCDQWEHERSLQMVTIKDVLRSAKCKICPAKSALQKALNVQKNNFQGRP
jgi:hypothetical protein